VKTEDEHSLFFFEDQEFPFSSPESCVPLGYIFESGEGAGCSMSVH
jgi:hypothetical protein